jgi:hypothetical protein
MQVQNCMANPKHITVMKRYYIYLVAFFVLICNITFAQTNPPAPTADNGSAINLDYNNGSFAFDKHFPFDKSFTIHITNIPTVVNKIEIRLQVNSDVINDYKHASKTSDNSSDVVLPAWERHDLDTAHPATTGTITVINYLKYNTDFLVKITASSTTPLTKDKKAALSAAMAGDPGIGEVINKMGKASTNNPAKILFDYSTDIFAALKKALQKNNPNYSFKEPDSIPVIPTLMKFRQGILKIKNQIVIFKGTRQDGDPQVESLRNAFNALNWGSIAKNSPQDSAFKKTLDALKSAQPTTNPSYGTDTATLGFIGKGIDPIIKARDELMTQLIEEVALTNAYEASALNTSYDPNFVNNSSFYITLDIGIPYVARVDRVIMYSGVNIYFRPIDKSIPLSRYKTLSWTRASLLLGVSLSSIEKAHERKGLIGSNALVLGLGYRILPFLKINAGTFCHYRYDINPVIDESRYHFSTSPFIGLSIDADIKQFFAAFGTPFQ